MVTKHSRYYVPPLDLQPPYIGLDKLSAPSNKSQGPVTIDLSQAKEMPVLSLILVLHECEGQELNSRILIYVHKT